MPLTDAQATEAAAVNNAEWCDAVCRTHGIRGTFGADAWTVPRRSPPRYPDAVTLRPFAADGLMERIDARSGASVKDSFAALDLAGAGFHTLFEAEWVYREPADVDGPPLAQVADADALAGWAAAHGGGTLFRPALLFDPTVRVWALPGAGGTVAGGAVTNRSGLVVGVSNVFATTADLADVWCAVLAAHPGEPLVGHASGDGLALAHRLGFRSVGPLRVWVHD